MKTVVNETLPQDLLDVIAPVDEKLEAMVNETLAAFEGRTGAPRLISLLFLGTAYFILERSVVGVCRQKEA